MNFQNKNNTDNLAFYSMYHDELELKFDCAFGSNVSHKFPLHIHESLCIGLITKGERNIIWPDKAETIHQNEIFVINKNQPHAISQIEAHDYIAITINGLSDDTSYENIIKSNKCVDLFCKLFVVIKDGEHASLSEKWNNLHQYLIDTHKLSTSLTVKEDFIRKSLEYIQANYQNQIFVNDIAAHACMSTYHFCRLFKQMIGLSPHNYLKQYRLSRSYKCLQQNTPVFDTAIETGFYDSSHFIRTFHSYMAVSPKKYQESVMKQ